MPSSSTSRPARSRCQTAQLDAQDEPLRSAVAAADAALAAQLATIDEEIDAAISQRAAQQDQIPAASADRYEALRKTFGGVAVARLNGRQREGCHLDIAAAEIDTLEPPRPTPSARSAGDSSSCDRSLRSELRPQHGEPLASARCSSGISPPPLRRCGSCSAIQRSTTGCCSSAPCCHWPTLSRVVCG